MALVDLNWAGPGGTELFVMETGGQEGEGLRGQGIFKVLHYHG